MYFGYSQALLDEEQAREEDGVGSAEGSEGGRAEKGGQVDNTSEMVTELRRQHGALSAKLEDASNSAKGNPPATHIVLLSHIPLFVRDVAEDLGGASLPLAARRLLLPLVSRRMLLLRPVPS